MYKPQKITPEVAYRRTKKVILALMNRTEPELQQLADAGDPQALSVLITLEQLSWQRASLYRKETK